MGSLTSKAALKAKVKVAKTARAKAARLVKETLSSNSPPERTKRLFFASITKTLTCTVDATRVSHAFTAMISVPSTATLSSSEKPRTGRAGRTPSMPEVGMNRLALVAEVHRSSLRTVSLAVEPPPPTTSRGQPCRESKKRDEPKGCK